MNNDPERRRAFGAALTECLTRAGMTQAELIRRLGSGSESKISEWRHGHKEPGPQAVFALEQALGCEPGELSRHLGYLPVGSVEEHANAVEAAIEADPGLPRVIRRSLIAFYREALRTAIEERPPER